MILIIGHEASKTGAPLVLYHFMKWMKEYRKEKMILLLRKGGELLDCYNEVAETMVWENDTAARRARFGFYKNFRLWDRFRKRIMLNRIIKRKPSLILSNTLLNGDLLELFSGPSIPVVIWVHELETVIKAFDASGRASKSLRLGDYFIAVSNAVKLNLENRHLIPGDKIRVVHEFVDFPKAVQQKRQMEVFTAGSCGSLIYRKGFDLFIQVADIIINKRKIRDIHFTWIGGNRNSEGFRLMENEIRQMKLEPHVTLTGEVENPYEYYSGLDVFLMTSREDPFPLVNIEAAYAGLPVIGFEKSGGTEEFIEEATGFIVPYLNVDAMADRILLLKGNRVLLRNMSERSHEKAKRYVVGKLAPEIYKVLERVL